MLAAALLGGAPLPASSQELADPILRGQVFLGEVPASAGMVVLHRVSAESQGEVDSVAVGRDGSFAVRLPTVPDPDRSEVYFASVRHAGILYFGKPVNLPIQLDSVYEIRTYDTAMVAAGGTAVPLEAREIFLQSDEAQAWEVVDLFQIRNAGERTLVAPEGGMVWSYPLPDDARDPTISDMGLGVGAAEVREGRLVITAPVPPGDRMFAVRYSVPDPFLSVPLPEPAGTLEILVREPAPALEAEGLTLMDRVELEVGSSYQRFGGRDVSGTVGLREGKKATTLPVGWLSFILALALSGVAVWTLQSGADRAPRPAPAPRGRRELLLEVAKLDEAFSQNPDPSAEDQGLYEARRRDLLRHLRELG